MKTRNLLFIPLLLTGCSMNESEFSIMVPSGAPAVCFASFLGYSNFEVNSGAASNILAQMVNENVDVAVLPTNAGVQGIVKQNLNYQIAATITFGNLYIASTGLDEDDVMGPDDYVVAFQKGQVPDKILQSVYDLGSAVNYVESAQEAAMCLKKKANPFDENHPVEYVLMAEPALTKLKNSGTSFEIYSSIQDEYKTKYAGQQIFQASIFVRKSLDHDAVVNFLSRVKSYVNVLKDNPKTLDNCKAVNENADRILGIELESAKQSISEDNRLGIGFEYAHEHKSEIDTFLKLWNMSDTNEEIYFK